MYAIRFFSVFCFVIFSTVCGGTMNEAALENKMKKNMSLAATWVIEDGISTYVSKGKSGLHRKLVDEWGVQIWVTPVVESSRHLALFKIKSRGINYDIHNLYRKNINNMLYEYWLIKVAAKPWSGEHVHSIFYVTKTASKNGKRHILFTNEQFFVNYDIDNNH